ncbi:MAG: ATP-binding protein, partial [Pseudomonadota bacterium]
ILKSGEHDDAFYSEFWGTVATGRVWSGRIVNRKKDGALYTEECTVSPVWDSSGTIVNFVALKRDITQHLALSQQLVQAQKMESIGTLAGGVAHDFNNILQVALGYSELILADEEFPRQYRTDLQKIHDSAVRGAELVQRLLTFSRKTDFKPRPIDLNRRIVELRKMLERTLPKMIDLDLALSEGKAVINADPTEIDQVLMNLAVNARDAMPDGGTLSFQTVNTVLDEDYARTHVDVKPGPNVLLTVRDTGSGMAKDTLEHIFEPFFTTKGMGEGTGLGLAMVHGIVKQHGGHIMCYSEPGHGTSFKIYFPAVMSRGAEENTIVGKKPLGGSETILLVDDEELIRDLGARILTKAGYKVIMTHNGREALEVYREHGHEIALVVLDLIMPEMGGKQCLEGMLSHNPQIKVVIASGFSGGGPGKDALEAGAKGFVGKPYDIRQMLEVIRAVLDA